MRLPAARRLATVMGAVLSVHSAVEGAQPPGSAAVDKIMELFERLRGKGPVSFQLVDTEINDYLKHSLRLAPRPGLESCSLKMFPRNYISTFTVVDFDAVERWKPGTIPVLLRPVLNGKKSIWVDFRFGGTNGKLIYSVQKAYFEGTRLPAIFVEKLIGVIASRQPERLDTSKPLPISFGVRSLWTEGNTIRGSK